MQRREFLLALGGLAAAGCTASADVSTPSDDGTTSSSGPDPTPSVDEQHAAASEQSAATSEPPSVDPVTAPPCDTPSSPFSLGVASGDPDSQSVVVWTRLTEPGDTAAVALDVALDPEFTRLVRSEVVATDASVGHSVHHVVTIEPDRAHYFRFRAGPYTSATGLARTFGPAAESVTLGASSCQNPAAAAWGAHRDIAADPPDLMLWLGDFVYETNQDTVDGYRRLYEDYLTDPDLQASRGACPWVCLLDDNDIANDLAAPGTGTQIADSRRLAGLQAWWEHQPVRAPRPETTDVKWWRTVPLGPSATLVAVDARLQRTNESLLGEEQRQWLAATLEANPNWTVVASQVMVSGFGSDEVLVPYAWEAYPSDRAVLAAAPGPTVAVTGDLHAALVGRVGEVTELMAPPTSSELAPDYASAAPFAPLISAEIEWTQAIRGWLRVTVDATEIDATFRQVDNPSDVASTVSDAARFTIGAGEGRPLSG